MTQGAGSEVQTFMETMRAGYELHELRRGDVLLAWLDGKTRNLWVRAFFGDDARYTWLESAKSDAGKRRGVEHFRLFCDATWKPILPRGEVYSTEFTELGWRSASQVLEEDGTQILSTVDPS
jgi:hypothetical protein